MKVIPEALKRNINQLSPAFFLGWIRKWSMGLFDQIYNHINNQIVKKQKEIKNNQTDEKIYNEKSNDKYKQKLIQKPKRLKSFQTNTNVSLNQHSILPKIPLNFVHNKNVAENNIILQCKQNIYSCCSDELKKYYKSLLPVIQDLDLNYLRNFKKIGKKQDIFSVANAKNIIQSLVDSKNKEIKQSITKFIDDYQKVSKKNKIKKEIMNSNNSIAMIKNKQTNNNRILLQKSSELIYRFKQQSNLVRKRLKTHAQSSQLISQNLRNVNSSIVRQQHLEDKIKKLKQITNRNSQLLNLSQKPHNNKQKYSLNQQIEQTIIHFPKIKSTTKQQRQNDFLSSHAQMNGSDRKRKLALIKIVTRQNRTDLSSIFKGKGQSQISFNRNKQKSFNFLSKSQFLDSNLNKNKKLNTQNQQFQDQNNIEDRRQLQKVCSQHRNKLKLIENLNGFKGHKKLVSNNIFVKKIKNSDIEHSPIKLTKQQQLSNYQSIISLHQQQKAKQIMRNHFNTQNNQKKNKKIFPSRVNSYQYSASNDDFIKYLLKLQKQSQKFQDNNGKFKPIKINKSKQKNNADQSFKKFELKFKN